MEATRWPVQLLLFDPEDNDHGCPRLPARGRRLGLAGKCEYASEGIEQATGAGSPFTARLRLFSTLSGPHVDRVAIGADGVREAERNAEQAA